MGPLAKKLGSGQKWTRGGGRGRNQVVARRASTPATLPSGAVQARARSRMANLWKQVVQALGLPAGTPMPTVEFMPDGSGYTLTMPTDGGITAGRKISISTHAAQQAASKQKKVTDQFDYAFFHEVGRYFGPSGPITTPGVHNAGAGNANAFANRALRYRNRRISLGQFRAWCRGHLPNYGKQPSTIPAYGA